jgi:hypothetical protein
MMRYALRLVAIVVISAVISTQHVLASGPPGVNPSTTSGNVGGAGANKSGTTAGVGVSAPTKSTVQVPLGLPNTGGGGTAVRANDAPFFTLALAIAVLLLGTLLIGYGRRWRPRVA